MRSICRLKRFLVQSSTYPSNLLVLSSRQFSVFVSSHFRVDENTIVSFFDRLQLSYKESPSHFIVRACPLCPSPHGNKADNLYKLYFRRADGAYFCHRCGNKGSWYDFKQKMAHGEIEVTTAESSATSVSSDISALSISGANSSSFGSDTTFSLSNSISAPSTPSLSKNGDLPLTSLDKSVNINTINEYSTSLFSPGFESSLKYLLDVRKLSKEVLLEYKVGAIKRKFVQTVPSGNVASSNGSPPTDAQPQSKVVEHECIVFPWIFRTDHGKSLSISPSIDTSDTDALTCSRFKLRSIQDKSKQMLLPKGGSWGLFGLHLVPNDIKSVVLTEGEFDAMAVRQATGMYALSLPNGARSLPVEVLPMLERFDRIYLWTDNDAAGREGAEKISAKLGIGRCYLVEPNESHRKTSSTSESASKNEGAESTSDRSLPKDANDALRQGFDLAAILRDAVPRKHNQIISFSDLRTDAMREIAATLGYDIDGSGRPGSGVPYRSLPALQQLLKGHRLGELTVVTGPTGSGKTTLLSQLSLDLCSQGVRTLWGSFEIKNSRLVATMLQQVASGKVISEYDSYLPQLVENTPSPSSSSDHSYDLNGNMYANKKEFHKYVQAGDVMANLPLFFLKFFGSTDVEQVIDALEYASYVYDIDHVILDNLQFMMSSNLIGRGMERYDIQEKALDKFRTFASKHNVHVTLVIHPRKESEDAPLTLSSVFGSAKATQEADTVFIIQRDRDGMKNIDVRKNRYDGTVGTIPLLFDVYGRCFVENKVEAINNTPSTTAAPSAKVSPNQSVEKNMNGNSSKTDGQKRVYQSRKKSFASATYSLTDSNANSTSPALDVDLIFGTSSAPQDSEMK
jgi:twinkle protein